MIPTPSPFQRPTRFASVKRHASGFTLIELMIVIAIIALLAEILFPAFVTARESARRSACTSNLKQIGLGIQQYLQDNDSNFPNCSLNAPNSGAYTGNYGWAYNIQPYLNNLQVFGCPDDTTYGVVGSSLQQQASTGGFTSYYYNYNLAGQTNPNPAVPDPSVPETLLIYTSSTVLCGDGTGIKGNASYVRTNIDTTPSCLAGQARCGALLHGGFSGGDYVFADGHAKFEQPQNVLDGSANCAGGTSAPTGSNSTFCIY